MELQPHKCLSYDLESSATDLCMRTTVRVQRDTTLRRNQHAWTFEAKESGVTGELLKGPAPAAHQQSLTTAAACRRCLKPKLENSGGPTTESDYCSSLPPMLKAQTGEQRWSKSMNSSKLHV